MKNYRIYEILLLVLIGNIVFSSCQKKGDYIDEAQVGEGIHYYPVILNESFVDTLTHKKIEDLQAKAGQKIIFQLKYRSKDSLQLIALWEKHNGDSQKVWHTPYDSSFYSSLQQCDTTYISYQIPSTMDTTEDKLSLIPEVKTKKGLTAEREIKLIVNQ